MVWRWLGRIQDSRVQSAGMMRQWLRKLQDNFGILLFVIIINYIFSTIRTDSSADTVIAAILNSTMFVVALMASIKRRRVIIFAFVFGAISVIASLMGTISKWGLVEGTGQLIIAVLLFVVPFVTAKHVFGGKSVTAQTVLAAICSYFIVGYMFASLFTAIQLFSGEPFFLNAVAIPQRPDFLYFSFVTLTTLGYGDLTAAGSLGRSLAALEAVVGILFTVILVSRLVSLWGMEDAAAAAVKKHPG